MDLGALDTFDRLREGQIEWVFLSEDSSKKYIEKLANACGFAMENSIVYTYRTSSQVHSAIYLAEFIQDIAPNTKIIIHRDRDFLTDNETEWVAEKIALSGAHPFITEHSDIEGYYVNPRHLSVLLEEDEEEVDTWLSDLAAQTHNKLMHKFTRKRDEAKMLYRNRTENPPETLGLLGEENPLPPEKRLGKFMIKKVRGGMQERFGKSVDITLQTPHLISPSLVQIREGNA